MNELINQADDTTMVNHNNSELMAYLATGASTPQAIAKYEAELMEISMKVIRGNLSDLEAVLSNQIINLNQMFTRFMQKADLLSYEACTKDADTYCKLALNCQDKASKAIAQLAKMKAPKKGSVYIRTLNNQINN
jgi:pyruvate carboxylase